MAIECTNCCRDLVRISKLWVQIFKYAPKTAAKGIFRMKIKGIKWTVLKICGCSCIHCTHAIQVPTTRQLSQSDSAQFRPILLSCLNDLKTLINREGWKICKLEVLEIFFIRWKIMSRVENFLKVNKQGGRGWKTFSIMNKWASPFIRDLRVAGGFYDYKYTI